MKRSILSSLWALPTSVGVLGLALFLGQCAFSGIPEVGPLDPIIAAPAERLEMVELRAGWTLGGVLQDASVGWSDQNALLLAFREQADPRRMRDGTRITLRWVPDEDQLRGVDVTLDRDESVRLRRDEAGWASELVHTPVTVDTVYASGVVEGALWNSVINDEELAHVSAPNRAWMVGWLDQVFQWQLDFSRQVRNGDTYRFVAERQVRPDGSMRDGHLLAAEYVNEGKPYRAIWFDPNGDGDGTFYDELGKSVRRAFLTKPIPLSRITSRFSLARRHPILNTVRAHRGVDFAANTGTPVMATGDGVVIAAGRRGDYGNLIEIRHPNGWITRYGHLSRFASGIRAGTRVRQSQIIGYVGSTGLSTGPHLHYEMRRGGEAIDPLSVRLPPGDPVPAGSWGRWAVETRGRLGLLGTLPGPEIVMAEERPQDQDAPGGPGP